MARKSKGATVVLVVAVSSVLAPLPHTAHGFVSPVHATAVGRRQATTQSPEIAFSSNPRPLHSSADPGKDPSVDWDGDDDNTEGLVTREQFQRDMLADPKVRRKKKNGTHYRTLDNRDSLPFVVKVVTPDPYTNPEVMKQEAERNTFTDREKNKSKKKGSKKGVVRRNLLGMEGIAASIYARNDDGTLDKVLGEFQLDKSTNCGDLVEVGGREFEVQKARCQYKYAGGKRFIMVRKILEVKEVTRIAEENYLKRLVNKKDFPESDFPPLEL